MGFVEGDEDHTHGTGLHPHCPQVSWAQGRTLAVSDGGREGRQRRTEREARKVGWRVEKRGNWRGRKEGGKGERVKE